MNRIIAALSAITAIALISSCTPKMRNETEIKTSAIPYNKEGLPIVDEEVSFKVGALSTISETAFSEGDYRIFDIMEEKTGVHIDWQLIQESTQTAKILLMFVSNSYPEAFYGLWNSPQDWQRMVDQGFLIPLDPYIEAGLMPNLSRKLEEKPDLLDSLRLADGHIYSLPRYFQDHPHKDINGVLHFNKKWLDTLGLEPPEDLNGLYEVLKAFKDRDPNGNGKKDEIPMSVVWDDNHLGLWQLFGSFGLQDNYWEHTMVRDGKVLSPNIQPEYKEAILFFRKLYSEGLLDIEFFSQSRDMYLSKVRNGQVGFFMEQPIPWAFRSPTVEMITENIVAVPPLKGLNGETPVWPVFDVKVWGSLEITNKCENPEILIRWADQFYDDKYGIQLRYGAENQWLQPADDGYTLKEMEPGFSRYHITFPEGPMAVFENPVKPTDEMLYAISVWDTYTPYKMKERLGTYVYTKEENKQISDITTDIKKLIDNKQVAWITGEAQIEEEWDWYLEELERMGIDKLFKIYQKYYDQSKK